MPACGWGCRDSLPSRWWRRPRSAPRAWCSPRAAIRPPCATTLPRRPAAPSAACSCWKTGASVRCWHGPWKRPPRSPRISASVPPRFPKAAANAMAETESPTVAPQTLTEDLIQLEDRWGAHNYRPLDVVVERASGVWVHAVDGRRYLDCLSSYSALNQGHCHPRIMQALIDQASRVTLKIGRAH